MFPAKFNVQHNGKFVVVSGDCVFGGGPYSVEVNAEAYAMWKSGTLAQDAFPNLSADDREFLISGISPKGWADKFGEDE